MKHKKQHINAVKTAMSTLALMLTLSAGTVIPGVGTEGDGTVPLPPKLPPVEEVSEADEENAIQPLIDKDDPTTKFIA